MRHMSLSGREPPLLFLDCLAASPLAAAARGCSNWSVATQRAPPLRRRHRVGALLTRSPLMHPQYAMFLTLVFLAELVAGISGFIFRHEVSLSSECRLPQMDWSPVR